MQLVAEGERREQRYDSITNDEVGYMMREKEKEKFVKVFFDKNNSDDTHL